MKTYIKPESTVIVLKNPVCLFKSSVGNVYYDTDTENYTRENNAWDIWGSNSDED